MSKATKQIQAAQRPAAPAAASPAERAVASAIETLATERDGLEVLRTALEGALGPAFAKAVELASKARGRLIVTGMGKSGHVARKIAATLASTGTPSHFVHPAEASHGDLGMIQMEDAVLAISWSGETRELADIISYCKRFRVGLIAMTCDAESALGRQANVTLALPKAREACPNGLAPTTSTTMLLGLGDAFAVALLQARGFSAQDFQTLHPGGRLGAQLRHVGSIMHRGGRLPLVSTGAPMSEALVVQSEKGFGCVIAVDDEGHLAGIVTDGDLRRHMGADLVTKTVADVMTKRPITISADLLLGEAIEIVETRGRSALVVVEGPRPVGIVHVLDLLRAGVA